MINITVNALSSFDLDHLFIAFSLNYFLHKGFHKSVHELGFKMNVEKRVY